MKAEILEESGIGEPRAKRRFIWRTTLRGGAAVLLAVLIAGIVAPHINAERFSGPIRRALEAWLGRKVEFQAVHFTLFSGPGFSLNEVLIEEDPRYGPEPFAYVPTLDARISWSKLLMGKIRFSSVRLDRPDLNFDKRPGDSWNVLELLRHLGASNSEAINFFPAFEVSDGRIDFRLGKRKTTLYMSDCDFSVSPQRSGNLSIQFAGWPARTDRGGMGFGHLRGTVNWFSQPRRNGDELQADIILDPSNLGELTTLFEGHDIGVHGTVSTEARIDGPLNALRISGDLRVDDIHRWDLFETNGEHWSVRYLGDLDLGKHRIGLKTGPEPGDKPAAVQLAMEADRFLKQPAWSIDAKLNQVPLQRAVPVARRLGVPIPESFTATGALNGSLEYSSTKGLSGTLTIQNLSASIAGEPRFQTDVASATIASDHFHLDPATVQRTGGATLRVGGDYYFSSGRVVASLDAEQFSAAALKRTLAAWFGAPQALDVIEAGSISGELNYRRQGDDAAFTEPATWSGSFRMAHAKVRLPVLGHPLVDCSGSVDFGGSHLSVTRFSGRIGGDLVHATYRYDGAAERAERLTVRMPAASLGEIQNALEPALRPGNLLARLRFTRRRIPSWLRERNMEADIAIGQLLARGEKLGSVRAHLIWRGPDVLFTSLRVQADGGTVWGHGDANLTADIPKYRFAFGASGIRWRNGILSAQGEASTSGFGSDVFANLRLAGTFAARDFALAPGDLFDAMQGAFTFTLPDGHPDLEAADVTASDGRGKWTGEVETGGGKLIANLQQAGELRRIIGRLNPAVGGIGAETGATTARTAEDR